MSKEAMKLALEALEKLVRFESDSWEIGACRIVGQASRALREALAEQPAQQEPVQRYSPDGEGGMEIDSLGAWVKFIPPQPVQRKPLTDEQVNIFINGRGDEDDDDYVEPIGDGFGLTDADLVRLVRRVEAAHNIKENT